MKHYTICLSLTEEDAHLLHQGLDCVATSATWKRIKDLHERLRLACEVAGDAPPVETTPRPKESIM